MRLLLLIREINWLAVLSVLVLIAAPIVTYLTTPEHVGISIAISSVALSILATRD